MHTGSKWTHSDVALGAASSYALLTRLLSWSALRHGEWGRTVMFDAGRLAGCWLSGLSASASERDGISKSRVLKS